MSSKVITADLRQDQPARRAHHVELLQRARWKNRQLDGHLQPALPILTAIQCRRSAEVEGQRADCAADAAALCQSEFYGGPEVDPAVETGDGCLAGAVAE